MRTKTTLLAVLVLVTAAAANNQKMSSELQNQQGSNTINVIVQLNAAPTTNDQATVAKYSGKVYGTLYPVNGMQVSLPASQAAALSNEANVKYISPDRPVFGSLSNTAPAVNAPYAWGLSLDGSNIGVAVIDSGILPKHSSVPISDLNKFGTTASRVVYSQSWINDAYGTSDGYGHGTHVAGIIGGNGYNSTGPADFLTMKGIAPNVQLINLRVLDSTGTGTDSSVIAAIQQAIKLKTKYNIRVINLSLGRPVYESYSLDPLCQAVEAAYQAGIVVVVAAGNDGRDNSQGTNGYGTIYSPGNDPYVITVGAMKSMGTPTRTDDLIATYSSKGPTSIDYFAKPDLVAPGNLVVSVLENPNAALAVTYPANVAAKSYYMNNAPATETVMTTTNSTSSGSEGTTATAVTMSTSSTSSTSSSSSVSASSTSSSSSPSSSSSSTSSTTTTSTTTSQSLLPTTTTTTSTNGGATTTTTTTITPAPSTYFILSGTSMATPAVSGAVALLLQNNPSLTPDQVKAKLMKTAYKTFPQYSTYTDPTTGTIYTDQYDLFTVGAGYLDIQAALQDTETFTGVAMSPVVAYDPTTQSVYFVNNSSAVWGGSSAWSSSAVWGGNVFVGSNSAVWGGSSPWASSAVWGGSAPWGNSTNSGFSAVWGGNSVSSTGASTSDSVSSLINGEK